MAGGRWLSAVADQRDIGALRSAAALIERELGGVDIVFANAGIQAFKPILTVNAVIPGLIDTALTRHTWSRTRRPPGSCSPPRARSASPGSTRRTWHRWWRSSRPTRRAW
jgi:NAD(P)-dependent dehydrogenase (short-subunit alcohol dehydrogenase family)